MGVGAPDDHLGDDGQGARDAGEQGGVHRRSPRAVPHAHDHRDQREQRHHLARLQALHDDVDPHLGRAPHVVRPEPVADRDVQVLRGVRGHQEGEDDERSGRDGRQHEQTT
ncbi:hypothetical protein [Nocardioides ungokensis]|uniref:hypothetical protein n=1 Tax=Nocardioides ungokensis TaxID=1643322 RepID=UPI0015DEF03A|nr:hypothetical protein [Nocardioides ungokensis]